MALINFNASDHTPTDPNTDYELLKPGWYVMEIIESDIRDTSAGDGEYIAFTFLGKEGEAANRRVWTNVHRINPNTQCMAIGRRQLGDICHAVGVLNPRDSSELHHKPLGIFVDVEKGKGGWKDKNRATKFCKVADIPKPKETPDDNSSTEVESPSGKNVFA